MNFRKTRNERMSGMEHKATKNGIATGFVLYTPGIQLLSCHAAIRTLCQSANNLLKDSTMNGDMMLFAKVIHLDLCKVTDLPHAEKWYEHKPESVAENDQVKILRNIKM